MTNRAFDAAVVGGGPAGMLAAITAAERGRRVVLVEKNDRLGRKLRITGKGRCNVTNNCEPRTVIESAPGNGRFLYGAVQAFPPEETMRFFESLVALESPDPDCPAMQGLSLRNCGVAVWERGKRKPVYTDFGELLFTHFGLSGPTILSASAHMRRMEPGRYAVEIDLKPALDDAQLDQRLLRDLEKNKNRNFCNALGELLPQKMIPVVVRRSGIPPEEKCNAVTREQRAALREVLRRFRVEISGFGPLSGAIVTAGGVSVREIDPKTMQSKLVPGLYFAGEIIDVDAYTGGFNLQIAFSTGYAAGSNL